MKKIFNIYQNFVIIIIGDNMDWVERKRKESELMFEKMKKFYRIPEKYKDAADLFYKDDKPKEKKLKLKKNKILKDTVDAWNKVYEEMQYKVPKEIGEELEKLFSDEDYVLGIHRTNLYVDQIQKLIFTNGLKNRSTEYSSTVQRFHHFPTMLQEIMYCDYYKISQGCVIVRLPKEQKLPIYFVNNGQYYILPEYIYGYIEVEDFEMKRFIKNPGYTDIHNYDPAGLLYDDDLIQDANRRKK